MTLLMGAVAYDPKVVTIWDGFRPGSARRAWPSTTSSTPTTSGRWRTCSPAASTPPGTRRWPGCAAAARRGAGPHVAALVMRDTDRDLTSVVVVRADSPASSPATSRGGKVGGRRGRLAAGDAAPAGAPAGRGRSSRLARPALRRRRRPARRPHRRRARRGAGAGGRRGRRRLHDRRQPPAVRAGRGRCRRVAPHAGPDRAVRPLQHDRRRRRAARGAPSGSASCCWRCPTPTPRCARCSTSRASSSGYAGPHERLRPLTRAVDDVGFYDAEGAVTAAE